MPDIDVKATAAPEQVSIELGAAGDQVMLIQMRLKCWGFTTGEVDGLFGGATKAAVKVIQQYLFDIENVPAPLLPETGGSRKMTALLTIEGFEPDGIVDAPLLRIFTHGEFSTYRDTLSKGAKGADVTRLQTRLCDLSYITTGIDGAYGGNTEKAITYFQKRNGLEESGIADKVTQRLLFSTSAVKSDRPIHPYKLVVSIDKQTVYAYEWESGSYGRLFRTMTCSTGLKETPTPTGTFAASTGPGRRWHHFKDFECWAQYAYYIQGDILFHSVLYAEQDENTIFNSSVRNLGKRASHGCVRLSVADAKWVWQNCPAGTTVVIK